MVLALVSFSSYRGFPYQTRSAYSEHGVCKPTTTTTYSSKRSEGTNGPVKNNHLQVDQTSVLSRTTQTL